MAFLCVTNVFIARFARYTRRQPCWIALIDAQ